MATTKIYIPTFYSDAVGTPARTLPHIFFYNGKVDCEDYFIQSGSTNVTQSVFPYLNHYSGEPGTGSLSLLFNNEDPRYGQVPTASLYTTYWETYVQLLFNPKTRLIKASAVIPIADYFELELNDVVFFRGNYFHLRAINDYNLSTGECNLQLLGPIIPDALDGGRTPKPCDGGPVGVAQSLGWSGTSSGEACSATPTTYYTTGGTISLGDLLYTDECLSVLVGVNGWYGDGTNVYSYDTGLGVTGIFPCPAPISFTVAFIACLTPGIGRIGMSGYTGGSGVYSFVGIGPDAATAKANKTPSLGGSRTFVEPNGNYVLYLEDDQGNSGTQPGVINGC